MNRSTFSRNVGKRTVVACAAFVKMGSNLSLQDRRTAMQFLQVTVFDHAA